MNPMDFWLSSTFWQVAVIVAAAGALHASFQLGVSVLTSLSAHSFGNKKSTNHLLGLGGSYILGTFCGVLVLGLSLTYALRLIPEPASMLWAVICGIGAGVGVAVLLFYYRTGRGTMLWLPRPAAEYLLDRIKVTKQSIEAFALGLITVVAELPFIAVPLLIVAMLFRGQTSDHGLIGLVSYGIIATLPLVILVCLIGSGKKLSVIQKWRENNKGFLQFAAGVGLIVVCLYLFSLYCLGAA